MRLPVTITNVNKHGQPTAKWFVTIGKSFRAFDQAEWAKDGLAWLTRKLAGGRRK